MRDTLARVALIAAYGAYVWWMMRPTHESPAPALWLTGTRATGALARFFGVLALRCEWMYWRAVT